MSAPDRARLKAEIDAIGVWYHALELAPGLVTPGWFDVPAVLDRMPWPDVRGLTCLDVGTYDGCLAFEMERRGAERVVALDIADHRDWDWPPELAASGPDFLAGLAGQEKGAGFATAHRALGSAVERVEMSVYDLSPEVTGSFDLVACGSLLLHLRDPLRALAAMSSVCSRWLLSAEQIAAGLSLLHRRKPLVRVFPPPAKNLHWWEPNVAGHRRMLEAGGFELLETPGPYAIPFGPGHPRRPRTLRTLREGALRRVLTGGTGVPHSAVLAQPIAG